MTLHSFPASRSSEAAANSPGGDILPVAGGLSITLPWPPRVVHQNGRPNRHIKAAATKAYRKACADLAWNAGVSPMETWTVRSITFCPPNGNRRDLDGMIGAFKSGQDGVADAMGADDASFRPQYHVAAPVKGGAVKVILIRIPIPD